MHLLKISKIHKVSIILQKIQKISKYGNRILNITGIEV